MSQTFDPAALTELFSLEEDTPGLVQTLVDDFVGVSLKLMQDIVQAEAAADFRKLEMGAHSLKSSAKVLGLNQLAATCLEIESAGRENRMNTTAVSQIASLRTAGLDALNAYLKSRH